MRWMRAVLGPLSVVGFVSLFAGLAVSAPKDTFEVFGGQFYQRVVPHPPEKSNDWLHDDHRDEHSEKGFPSHLFKDHDFRRTFIVFGGRDYQAIKGRPVTSTETFIVARPGTGYTLRLFNGGDPSRFPRVTSAVVSINGRQILGPSDFNSNVVLLEREIRLEAFNRLFVEIRGTPGSASQL